MPLTTVAIIIPTYKRFEMLERCLSRLIPYVSTHQECSITISDNGDAEETRKLLGVSPDFVKVVQGPCRGPASNRNCGASHSAGDLLIFLDDDCVPELNLIATYQDAAQRHPETGVFEGRISAAGMESGFADAIPANETGGYLWACNFAIRRELFEKINGFDERYPFSVEDVDLHLRVKKHSAVLFLPDARVWHYPEPRHGWGIVKHQTLCVLLHLHIHGLKAMITFLFKKGWHHLCAGTTKNPEQLIFQCWACLQLALILTFWRHHPYLARRMYPQCCRGCELIHAALSSPGRPWCSLPNKASVP
jgi:glycosyltransferase involved in cell wall biosynthesis